jgi:PAS domain S-box-containing protein
MSSDQNGRPGSSAVSPTELYRSLVEASPDPIIMYDLSGRLLMASQQAARVMGLGSSEEVLARVPTIFDLLDKEGRARAQTNFAHTLATGLSQKTEYRLALPSGPMITEINSTLVRGPTGEPHAFVSVVRDITERKMLEEHLRTQKQLAERLATAEQPEEALRMCLEAAIAHSEADCGLAAVVEDDASLRMIASTGFRTAQLLLPDRLDADSAQAQAVKFGQPFYGRHDAAPENIQAFAKAEGLRALAILPILVEGRPAAAFCVMSHERDDFIDVSRRWIENVGAQVAGVLGRLLSLAKRRQVEAQLQHAMKMEAVGRLAGGVAHDFNNLLTGVLGNLSLALMDLDPQHPVRGYLDEASRAAENAAALVRQLLAFSRKQIVEPRVFDLNELLANTPRLLERLIGEDVELRVFPLPGPAHVKADPGQIEQVLVNLSVNARDAMPRGGRLTIETSVVALDAEYCKRHLEARPGPYVMLAASDNGVGISEEVRPRLFEPFFTTKPAGRGTGLGLATAYGIIKQAGGSIEVYSEVGHGTTFKIYLPQVDETAAAQAASLGEGELSRGSETVMIVEDDQIVRGVARAALERLGYRVLQASNGAEALRLADQTPGRIDLLMTDVVMPGMNGRELAERLQTLRPDLKVLFASGYTENVVVHHGVVEAGVHFLAKPYVPSGLARKVRQVLDGSPSDARDG